MTNANDDLARRRRLKLVGVCLSFAIVSLLYRSIYAARLETSALMFIGVPAAMAVLLVLVARPKSALGTAMLGITVGLLLSAVLFGEGVVCVLMAAPICYIVGAIVGVMLDWHRSNKNAALLLIPIVLSSAEGFNDRLSLPRDETVSAQAIVSGTPGAIEAALAAPWHLDGDLPSFLRLGFPTPTAADGSGLAVGDDRRVRFRDKPHDGVIAMRIRDRAPESVTFQPVIDDTMIAHWLQWGDVNIAWTAVDRGHTRIVWTVHYRRQLDPAWYFGPAERYAVRRAAEYLVRNVAGSVDARKP